MLQRNSLIMSLLLLSNDSELPLLRNFFFNFLHVRQQFHFVTLNDTTTYFVNLTNEFGFQS